MTASARFLAKRLSESGWLAIDCATSLENAVGIVSRERLATEANPAMKWLVEVLTAASRSIESVAILDRIGEPGERPGESLERAAGSR